MFNLVKAIANWFRSLFGKKEQKSIEDPMPPVEGPYEDDHEPLGSVSRKILKRQGEPVQAGDDDRGYESFEDVEGDVSQENVSHEDVSHEDVSHEDVSHENVSNPEANSEPNAAMSSSGILGKMLRGPVFGEERSYRVEAIVGTEAGAQVRISKQVFTVPYSRFSSIFQDIHRRGGKIVNITPL